MGSIERIQPGNGLGDVPQATAEAIEEPSLTCKVRSGTSDATCYDPIAPGNVAGITIAVAAITSTGANNVRVDALIGFRLMCVFRGGTGNGNNQRAIPGESCPWLADYRTDNDNYIRGTLVGYPVVTVAKTGRGNALGATIGPAQKLVLVQ